MIAISENEIRIKGQPLSTGVGVGRAVFVAPYNPAPLVAPSMILQNPKAEKMRYKQALKASTAELKKIKKELERNEALEAQNIIEAHLVILADPILQKEIEEEIFAKKNSALSAVKVVLERYEKQLKSSKDRFFQERLQDIKDALGRITGHLANVVRKGFSIYPKGSVLIAKELSPSDVAAVKPGHIAGILLGHCGFTSHVAILARAKKIPLIANLDLPFENRALEGETAVVDAELGEAVFSPLPETKARYQALLKTILFRSKKRALQGSNSVRFFANIGDVAEVDAVERVEASGVGLFRSEYLCLSATSMPSEEEQFVVYRRLAESFPLKPVTIRAFDLQGDKPLAWLRAEREENPALGCRGLRFLFKHENLFREQVRAVLRASCFGKVFFLLPMVTVASDVKRAKILIERWREELVEEGYQLPNNLPLGCMIEVPSAAFAVDQIAKECDFLSIGTNDLSQYFFAHDRKLFSHETDLVMHPSFLRLIQDVVERAIESGVPISLCGEMASDPKTALLLVGLGVKDLSMTPELIPAVRDAIERSSQKEAEKRAELALS